jgi:hypothetical protein
MSLLHDNPPLDLALDLIDVLKANASADELMANWQADTRRDDFHKRVPWLLHGLHLGCLSAVPLTDLEVFRTERPLRRSVVSTIFRARRSELFEASEDDFNTALDAVLALSAKSIGSSKPQRILEMLAQAVNSARYAVAFGAPQSTALSSLWDSHHSFPITPIGEDTPLPPFENGRKSAEFIREAIQQSQLAAVDWATQLAPWDSLVEKGRKVWGDRWAFYHLANVASGIRSAKETSSECADVFDHSTSLCGRARFARLRAGNASWWPKQLSRSSNSLEQAFIILLWASWGSPATIRNCEVVDAAVTSLPGDEWSSLHDSVEEVVRWTKQQSGSREIPLNVSELPKSLSPRTVVLLKLRANAKASDGLYERYLRRYTGDDVRVLRTSQASAVKMLDKEANWTPHLSVISRSFKDGVVAEPYSYQRFRRGQRSTAVPLAAAVKIMQRADAYPSYLVAVAEARCKEDVATKLVPVARTADTEGWFDE